MTPEEHGERPPASTTPNEDFDDDCTVVGGWCSLGLGYPPDPVKLHKLIEERAPWILTGAPPPPEPTPEERLKATEEAVAHAAAQGIPVPPNLLQVAREEAARARRELDQAAAARPARPEPAR